MVHLSTAYIRFNKKLNAVHDFRFELLVFANKDKANPGLKNPGSIFC